MNRILKVPSIKCLQQNKTSTEKKKENGQEDIVP